MTIVRELKYLDKSKTEYRARIVICLTVNNGIEILAYQYLDDVHWRELDILFISIEKRRNLFFGQCEVI